ncbi:(2Fe-2S)-binding protein [Halobacillus hunanensis]|uniref:(2Fe-2S)-binding protein n=1 Tax=Halobacillus hunanensis TaxID=578214 RepID=UPI0009A8C950|nr:(2Fe-2S)-binding protein [Halobacillus hunanensis]
MNRRILDHPILGKAKEDNYVSFTFNHQSYKGLKNEPLAAALLANGVRTLRYHEESGSCRGIYCNIGHCFECRVTVNGKQAERACLTPLQDGMVIESNEKLPTPVKDWSAEHE